MNLKDGADSLQPGDVILTKDEMQRGRYSTVGENVKFGDPIKPGNKPEYEQLTVEDIKRVKEEVETLMNRREFSDEAWGLE